MGFRAGMGMVKKRKISTSAGNLAMVVYSQACTDKTVPFSLNRQI
jgi:hypothetical protein